MSAAGKLVRESRIARTTGVEVELIDAEHPDADDYNADEGGRWVTACDAHGSFVQHETWKAAREHLGHPEEWCEACRETAGGREGGRPPNGFSAEERARAAESRRRKAAERKTKRDAAEAAKREAASLEEQWSQWIVHEPMVDRLYVGDEKERHEKARAEVAEAKAKVRTAKRGRRAAEESVETVTRLKIKSRKEKKNLDRLEGERDALDAEVVAEEDRGRIASEIQTRLARIAFVRGCIHAGYALIESDSAGSGYFLAPRSRDPIRLPDDFLDREGYSTAVSVETERE